jgi:RNA polymerase sigma factor (sigma-70 family)
MSQTPVSLLERLREQPDAASWRRLVDLYTPLVHDWLRRQGLQHQDAEDIGQDVLAAVVRELPQFHYDRQRGSFRGWLRAITANRLRAFWRARRARPIATGGSDFHALLEQIENPHSDLSRRWDQEHDRHVARRLLEMIRPEFEPTTWRAFERVVVEGARPAEAATELGISVNAVFIAKSRIQRRLRQELRGLID